MLVTLKTLQEDTFTVEIDPMQTVKQFKEKIEKVKGRDFPAKNMKLMYAGKFLLDANKVCDYNVEEKKFVIVVVKKPKTSHPKDEEPESTSDLPSDRVPPVNGSGNSEHDHNLYAPPDSLISHITELGFTRGEVEAALSASFNNPDRAVEYLINGVLPSSSGMRDREYDRNPDNIPDSSDAQLIRNISRTGPPSPGSACLPSQERIFQLFSEAMNDCQNENRLIDSLLDQDHEMITQSFAEMEAERRRCRFGGAATSSEAAVPMPDSSVFPETERVAEPWASAIQNSQGLGGFARNLVDRDHEAIERLKQLGFSDHKAIEAYFVCERNENAAADYLFSQNFD